MDVETAYNQVLDYLYSHVDYSLTRSLHYSPELFDLSRMAELLQRLGSPQDRFQSIHVAGTKGKGSVCALCASALQAGGYRTGLYTSPHLSDFTERIQVDGQPISHADLVSLIDEIKPVAAAIPRLTTFELTTAAAFLYFARRQVQAAVIEVGLGGRLDATNLVTPLVSVITSLSMDHMNVLGDTLPRIAAEKAGIIKSGRPVVSAPQREDALQVLRETAARQGSPFILTGDEYRYAPLSHSLDGQSMYIWQAGEQEQMDAFIESSGSRWQPRRLDLPLLGYHQLVNAAVAFAALNTASNAGLPLKGEAIASGFSSVKWPGRFEILNHHPFLVVDSAHNADSALKLRLALDDYFPEKKVILLFGASEDKDIRGMLSVLLPRVREVIATQSVHPRAMDTALIVQAAHEYGVPAKAVMPLESALRLAVGSAGEDALVLAAGSLFIAAAVRDCWLQDQDHQESRRVP